MYLRLISAPWNIIRFWRRLYRSPFGDFATLDECDLARTSPWGWIMGAGEPHDDSLKPPFSVSVSFRFGSLRTPQVVHSQGQLNHARSRNSDTKMSKPACWVLWVPAVSTCMIFHSFCNFPINRIARSSWNSFVRLILFSLSMHVVYIWTLGHAMSISLFLHVCNFTSLFRRRVFIHALAQATISLQDICLATAWSKIQRCWFCNWSLLIRCNLSIFVFGFHDFYDDNSFQYWWCD